MLGYIDWIIILIAIMAAIGALLLLYPLSGSREVQDIRDLRSQADNDRRRIADVLEITQHGAKDAEQLMQQIREQAADVARTYQTGQARVEQAEKIIERVVAAENEMRDISTQLGERIQHLQGYWDEQLGDSVESVKNIRLKLREGLEKVDESLGRLHEQEKMAQGFTRKLIEHHQEQAFNQQENSRLSAAVHSRLEDMLKESGVMLEQMKRYQQEADTVFNSFQQEMTGLEAQANEHFTNLFQTTDQARVEVSATLEESRQHLSEMRLREAQSDDLTRRIQAQLEQVDSIRVERISQSLDLTDKISTDLKMGVENARAMLSTLEKAVTDVTSTLNTRTVPPPPTAVATTTSTFEAPKKVVNLPKLSLPEENLLDTLMPAKPAIPVTEAPQAAVESEKLAEASTNTLENPQTADNLVALRAYR